MLMVLQVPSGTGIKMFTKTKLLEQTGGSCLCRLMGKAALRQQMLARHGTLITLSASKCEGPAINSIVYIKQSIEAAIGMTLRMDSEEEEIANRLILREAADDM